MVVLRTQYETNILLVRILIRWKIVTQVVIYAFAPKIAPLVNSVGTTKQIAKIAKKVDMPTVLGP